MAAITCFTRYYHATFVDGFSPPAGYQAQWRFNFSGSGLLQGPTAEGLGANDTGSYPAAGDACPAGTVVVALSFDDYNALRSHMSGVTTTDVALLTGAVMLVWAIAWLWKRAIRVLIPNG